MIAAPCRIALEGRSDLDLALLLPPGGDLMARAIRARGWWDLPVTTLAAACLRPGDRALDAGAHVGYFSLLFSRLVGPNGVVHAVEPNPASRALLQRNRALNAADNIVVWPVGLGDRRGRASVVPGAGNSGDATLRGCPSDREGTVALETADGLLAGEWPLDLIKIDVQGDEARVLSGMSAGLRAGRDRLVAIVEYHPGRIDAGDLSAHLNWLASMGAQLWDFERWEPRLLSLRRTPLTSLVRRMARASAFDTDFSVVMAFSDDALARLSHRIAENGGTIQFREI